MTGLNETQRTALERVVIHARATIEDDLAATLRGQYGIDADGTIEDEDRLADDEHLRTLRRALVEILDYLRAAGSTDADSVERLVREATFTHVNRLVAIRVADALGVLPPSLRAGPRSEGFQQILQLAPLLATYDDTGGYWTYLQLCADELARDVPALFDPRNPMLALRPSRTTIDTIVADLADDATRDIWSADDTFGWAYQFFNTGDERKAMREASAAPRDSRELAVRNQFFTPRYVVDFLTQNTLGRRLLDANPESALLEELPLLIDPPIERGAPHELAETRVLDPACGSGHFLLGCYEILEKAWALEGVDARSAAPKIVPCLWGIDIDPRAVQVAQAAVIFRARRACGSDPLPPPNIATARALPDDEDIWIAATSGLTPDRQNLVDAMRVALREAPTLGTLLKAEEHLIKEIRSTVVGADPDDENLFSAIGIATDTFGQAERDVIRSLQKAADLAESSVADRLLAANANDSIRFLEAVRHRYDAVLMNPPFGEPIAESKPYLRAAYPWIPTRDFNLLAAFVGRGVELCRPEGYMGAITSRAGLFLKTFEDWRDKVLLGHRMIALADLGFGVMEQALVEAAAYVVSPQPSDLSHRGVYIRLLKDVMRSAALADAVSAERDGRRDSRVYRVTSGEFALVPGRPISYWMGDAIRKLFATYPTIESSAADVRVGLQTGDNFRFLRLWWEVPSGAIGSSRIDTSEGKPWVPYAKGGDYSPYWADLHLVVNYVDDGRLIRQADGSVIRNPGYYFRAGVTWTTRTASAFGARALPAGAAFDTKGLSAFSTAPDTLLAWLRTRYVQVLLDALVAAGDETTSGGAAKSYDAGLVQRLPWPIGEEDAIQVSSWVRQMIALVALADRHDETCHLFRSPLVFHRTVVENAEDAERASEIRSLEMIEVSSRIEAFFGVLLKMDESGYEYMKEEIGPHPQEYGDSEIDEELLCTLLVDPIDKVIDELTTRLGGARSITSQSYIADRRLEVLAHAFRCHPRVLVGVRQGRRLLPAAALEGTAAATLSWAVGLAFGRWDVRGPQDDGEFDPFAPLPVCPPAMLVGADGFPVKSPPAGYPIPLPSDWVLLDEPGSPLDLAAAVDAAAAAASPKGEDLLADAAAVLGRRSVREYLAKQFFKDHISRYSKSRRQAPLYWQLTIPSGAWSAWIYAPMFSREMLFAVVREADRRLAAGAERVRAWVLEQGATGNGRELSKRLDTERALIEQLTEFRNDIARIAGLGWEPDLDDGFVLNAAPLSRWFPKNTWKQASEALDEIRKGKKFGWATIHQYRGQL